MKISFKQIEQKINNGFMKYFYIKLIDILIIICYYLVKYIWIVTCLEGKTILYIHCLYTY